MNNCTTLKEQKMEEYFGWIGNSIFISAQMFQIIHTFKVKQTHDLSYGLQICMIIGNSMYTTFGLIDNSLSMFLGNLITLFMSMIQLSQKIYYDKKYYSSYDLIN
tara:strand:+ start:449 stop:763 length:315 start_codon:yes stop_codon:yes gene_type:complete